jgi:Domain of unknown function (DUF397)
MNEINWRKSTHSRSLGNCVEVGNAQALVTVAVRDSQDPDGPVINVNPQAWITFTEQVKRTPSGYAGR